MRLDGIACAGDSQWQHRVRTPNQLRLSNKLYALQRPMAKLVLLQQLGISVPEIYSSKNLKQQCLQPKQSKQQHQLCKPHLQRVQKQSRWLREGKDRLETCQRGTVATQRQPHAS